MYDKDTCWYHDYCVDEMNRFYDAHILNHDVQPHFKPFTDLLNMCDKGGKLLDMGCGTAFTSTFCKDFKYYGCDLPHILSGCAMRNFPNHFYRACDIVEDEIAWIKEYDVIVLNGVIDIVANGLGVLSRILTHASNYVLIHRQEITEQGVSTYTVNGSYGGETYHSIIKRSELYALLEEMDFEILGETSPGFTNWENGGASFLFRRKTREQSQKYESHPLRQLKNRIQQTAPLKVVLGAGDVSQPTEWICTNEEEIDIHSPEDFEYFFEDKQVDNFLCEHVYEHLAYPNAAARNMFKHMKSGGVAIVAVPDGYHTSSEYIEDVRPGGKGAGSDTHYHLWNYETFTELFERNGFVVKKLEWWDKRGIFNYEKWNPDYGIIRRSLDNDERNKGGSPCYTSLILELTKP